MQVPAADALPQYQTELPRGRYYEAAGPQGQQRCQEIAAANGATPADADDCDDGSVGCIDCPWLRQRNTSFEQLQGNTQFVVLAGPEAGRLLFKRRAPYGPAAGQWVGLERRRGVILLGSEVPVRACRSGRS